jgi:hypothetical protein
MDGGKRTEDALGALQDGRIACPHSSSVGEDLDDGLVVCPPVAVPVAEERED